MDRNRLDAALEAGADSRGGYKLLEEYGLVGNLETCALIGRDGAVDWCCLPFLQSPSVFAAILDVNEGGHFSIAPSAEYDATQAYRPETNVLETAFETESGTAVLTDFMPMLSDDPDAPFSEPWLYRKVECRDGEVPLHVEFVPRFDYAMARTVVEPLADGIIARGNGEHVSLTPPVELTVEGDRATGQHTLEAGKDAWYSLQYGQRMRPKSVDPQSLLDQTEAYWQNWTHDCPDEGECLFAGPEHDLVVRSELVLKLLKHHMTGAIAAAPTTSLPELVGGERNWDYRFSWIRDATFTVQALFKLGHVREAEDYFDWCVDILHTESETFQPFSPLYGLHGTSQLSEEVLYHLSGYRDSAPVRIGNAARNQLQLDVYGELVLAIYETSRFGVAITETTWETVRQVVEYVCSLWDKRDAGMWEVRSDPEHFVHSKVMCWVALDRGIELAETEGFEAPLDHWRTVRDQIRSVVLDRGFDETHGCFGRSFEATHLLDAAALRIPLVGFLPFGDQRVQGTIDAIKDRLTTEDGLVHRYEGEDGLAGGEGAFILCSFWLVDSLALSGRVEEAEEVFESVVDYASPLGLLAEEVDAQSGELRGNYPQGFSHLGLINSTMYLRSARNDDQPTATRFELDASPLHRMD
ncbi:glycoside hydrolase family 15 protein [Halobacteriales archaeon Cl-PHB]